MDDSESSAEKNTEEYNSTSLDPLHEYKHQQTMRTSKSPPPPPPSSSSSVILWLTLSIVLVTAASSADQPSLILDIPGDNAVLLLMDVQDMMVDTAGVEFGGRGGGEGKGEEEKKRSREVNSVIPLLLGAVNMVDRIQDELNVSLGLKVYDTSTGTAAVLRLMAGLVSEVSTTPAAVITMTPRDLTSSLSAMLQSMGVLHVDIRSDDVDTDVSLKSEKVVIIPRYTPARVQAAVTLLEALNITYVAPVMTSGSGGDNSVAQSELTDFRQLAKQSPDLCSVASPALDTSPITLLLTGSGGGGGGVSDDGEADVVVVVGDEYDGSLNGSLKTVLWLRESVDEVEIEDMLQINLTESSAGVTSPFNSTLCTSFHVTTTTTATNVSTTDTSCALHTHTVRALEALSDAFAYVTAASFADLNVTQRTSGNVSSDDDDIRSPLEQVLEDPNMAVPKRRRLYDVLVFEGGKLVESREDVLTMYDNVIIPELLLQRNFSNRCEVNCHVCDACVPDVKSDRKVLTSSTFEKSSLLVVGLFPVSQPREVGEGGSCDLENPEGLDAAHWFISALESYKDRNKDSFHNLTVGGVVLDTCGDRDRAVSVQRDIEACFASYKDYSGADVFVQPSRVVVYVDFKNYGEQPELQKAVMRITDDEFGFSTRAHVSYFHVIGDILKAIRWSFLKLVVSEDYVHRAQAHDILKANGLCVAEEILVNELDLNQVSSMLTSSPSAVLFLTDHPTTFKLLQTVYSRNSSARLKSVFMPWNTDVLDVVPKSFIMETAIVTQHVTPDSVQFPRTKDRQDPWRGTLERVFTNQSSRLKGLSLVPLAVDSMMASLSKVYQDLCPEGQGLCSAMEDLGKVRQMLVKEEGMKEGGPTWEHLELEVFAVRGRSKVKIGDVDPESRVHMNAVSIKRIPPSQCPGWCPQCLHCQSPPLAPITPPPPASEARVTRTPAPRFYSIPFQNSNQHSAGHPSLQPLLAIPGDLLIAGVFPVHEAGGESFRCGQFVDSLDEKRAEQAFLFALSTAKRRYSNLLPGVSVGGVLLDSCSSLATGLHTLGQFESCQDNPVTAGGPNNDTLLFFSPVQVVGYLLQDSFDTATVLKDTVRGLHKMASVTSPQGMKSGPTSLESPEKVTVDAMLKLFSEFDWGYTYILTSEDENYMNMAEYFVDEASYRGICVVRYLQLISAASNVRTVSEILSDTTSVPVILFLSRADAVTLFQDRKLGAIARPWVISMIGDDWLSTVGINIPWGALLVDVQGKINDDFQVFLEQFSTYAHTPIAPWWRDYLRVRLGCQTSYSDTPLRAPPASRLCAENPLLTGPMYPSATASRVIRGVDSLLHAVNARYKTRCPETRGICRDLSSDITGGLLSLAESSFMYEEGVVSFDHDENMEITLSIMSYQPGQLVMAGTYRSVGLSINNTLIQFFTPEGKPLPRPVAQCPSCTCINVVANVTQSPAPFTTMPPALAHWLWREERGVFIREMWAWTILSVSVGGAFTTMCFILYVMYKVWQGALARRYIGLGLLLLSSITLLFLSAFPFLFTPSLPVCGLRYVFPPVSLCLCMACVLVKLMALQDYRTIGLGGELSGLNQGLSVFFIVLVQISISVQWWVFKGPFLHEIQDARDEVTKFSCLFQPADFALNLSFVTFLVVLCALYSISVRREKKNMGEARLLLAGSWTVLVLWLAWVPLLLLLQECYAPVVACSGVTGTALALLLVVFVPKVRMVARLKYDLSKKQAVRNGYSVDTDFLYERPYSLPGTLTSTYSSIRTCPKSITATNFDSSLSY